MDTYYLNFSKISPVFFSLILLFSCEPKNTLQAEYKEMAEAASKLNHGSLMVLNTDSSKVDWEVSNQLGQKVSGKIKTEKGTLILEKERLVAGFFSGNLSSNTLIDNQLKSDINVEMKKILDSIPRIKTEKGKIIRLDIEQSSHQVLRSGFRESFMPGTDPSATHLFQVKITFADSTRSISLPAKLAKTGKNLVLDANLSINYMDYGVQFNRYATDPAKAWNSWIPVKLHLVFSPYLDDKAKD
jgi:hypothetical protein